MDFLRVNDLSKTVNNKAVVDQVSFSIHNKEKLAIAGETGSGKTTLLKMIAGLIQPDHGTIYLEDSRILGPEEQLMAGHPKIGFLSQHFELRNNYRVEEIMDYSNKLSETKALEIFEICGIAHLLKRYTNALSGGEKQRIALARLLITAPDLLLLDEPFSNLDEINKKIIYKVLQDVSSFSDITIILVSHDPFEILSWADKIIIMKDGKAIQEGSPRSIYFKPRDKYVAGLMGEYNLLPAILNDNPHLKTTSWFIRPYQLILLKVEPGLPVGTVQQVTFHGSYYRITVLIVGSKIIVYSLQNNFAISDTVSIRLCSPD